MMTVSGHKKKQLTAQNFTVGQLEIDLVQLVDAQWFQADSLARTLGYSAPAEMLAKLPADEFQQQKIYTDGKLHLATLVNEAGFMRAVVHSRRDTAEPLKRWIMYEVLPKLRGTGQYKAH